MGLTLLFYLMFTFFFRSRDSAFIQKVRFWIRRSASTDRLDSILRELLLNGVALWQLWSTGNMFLFQSNQQWCIGTVHRGVPSCSWKLPCSNLTWNSRLLPPVTQPGKWGLCFCRVEKQTPIMSSRSMNLLMVADADCNWQYSVFFFIHFVFFYGLFL